MNNVLMGAAAGTIATVPMTIFWEAMHERLPGEPPRPLPPREVAEALAVKAGVSRHLSEIQMEWLSMALHFGYGAFTGAVFGALAPRRIPEGVAAGMLFGLGVWTTSYLGWLPATGVRHSPRFDVPARTALVLTSHLVWGAAAGLLMAATRRGSRGAE
jgi:uncharacterized membrane protein YagU involved in acid resistance